MGKIDDGRMVEKDEEFVGKNLSYSTRMFLFCCAIYCYNIYTYRLGGDGGMPLILLFLSVGISFLVAYCIKLGGSQ